MSVFSGKVAFELKATHGLPLDFILNEVIVVRRYSVDWPEFIATARSNKRWDFQTIADIETALEDAGATPAYRSEVISRCKLWILQNPIR